MHLNDGFIFLYFIFPKAYLVRRASVFASLKVVYDDMRACAALLCTNTQSSIKHSQNKQTNNRFYKLLIRQFLLMFGVTKKINSFINNDYHILIWRKTNTTLCCHYLRSIIVCLGSVIVFLKSDNRLATLGSAFASTCSKYINDIKEFFFSFFFFFASNDILPFKPSFLIDDFPCI